MRSTIQKIGLLVAMLMAILPASAYDFEVDGIYYKVTSLTDFTCEVTSGDVKYSGDIVIPGKVTYNNRELKVLGIGKFAFENSGITSIVIQDPVSYIYGSAFYGCAALTSVILPESLKVIHGDAFRGCTALTSIDLPNSVTSIPGYTFYECTSLTSIDIPDSVTSIGDYAFGYCTNLTSIKLPESLRLIAGKAFAGCSLLKSIVIPDSVTSIGKEAFYECCALTSIVLPEPLDTVRSKMFFKCGSLESVVIPGSVKYIDQLAFYRCERLVSIDLPESLTKISYEAFEDCYSLTSIDIPNSVTSIANCAFYNCIALKHIKLSEGLTRLEYGTFYNCVSLSSLSIPGGLNELVLYLYQGKGLFSNCKSVKELEIKYGSSELQAFYDDGYSVHERNLYFPSIMPIEKAFIDRGLASNITLDSLRTYTIGEHIATNQVNLSESAKLDTIISLAVVPPILGKLTTAQYMNVIVQVPEESLEVYKSADGWKNFWNIEGFNPPESAIDEISINPVGKTEIGRYDLQGRRVGDDYEGLTIIKYSDGSAKKIAKSR